MLKRILIRFEWLILIGAVIAVWSMLNAFGVTNTPSDVFWSIAGIGLVVEGVIELYYEHQADVKKRGEE